jgi:hypothetical protein
LLEKSLATVKAIGRPSTEIEGHTEFNLNVKLKVDFAVFQMDVSSFCNRIINDNYKLFLEELVPGEKMKSLRMVIKNFGTPVCGKWGS